MPPPMQELERVFIFSIATALSLPPRRPLTTFNRIEFPTPPDGGLAELRGLPAGIARGGRKWGAQRRPRPETWNHSGGSGAEGAGVLGDTQVPGAFLA